MPALSPGSDPTAVNKDYCFRHAQMYEGWECPLCAAEKASAGSPALVGGRPSGSASGGGSAAPAVGPGGGIITPASRSASRERSTEAQHILDAGDPKAALTVCTRAIELDPTNLHAYVVGARAADRAGSFQQQEELVEEGARLLHQPEYRRVARWYLDLLRGARDAAMARPIVASFIASGPWPPADLLGLVRTLVSRGFGGEALRILESVPVDQRSLQIAAYSAQLTKRAFGISDPEVDAYLAAVPATERQKVLAEVRQMCDEGAFPVSTLLLIRDAARARYRTWGPEIRQAIELEARKELTEQLAPEAVKPAYNLALRVGGGVLGAFVVLSLALGGSAVLFVLGLVLAVGGAVGAFVYGRETEVTKRLVPLLPARIDELLVRERDDWQLILDDQAAPFATPPAPEPPPQPAPPEPPSDQTPAP